MKIDDQFQLYDLEVSLDRVDGKLLTQMDIGDTFRVEGENLIFPAGGKFSMYALASIIPLLPAKQRMTHENDWMTTDDEIRGPDANCDAIFKIKRVGMRSFKHSETSGNKLNQ